MQPDFDPVTPATVEWQGSTPYAPDFGDGYFSREDGPGEARAVFIDASRLAERFAGLAPGEVFVVGETGFGTGLNMLMAAAAFAETAPAAARLSLVTAEMHPLMRTDLDRALAHHPALEPFAGRLKRQYPALTPGFHRIDLADNIELTVMLGDAETMWRHCDAAVDAWFLDGFAPERNPAMWRPGLLTELAGHSRPGATLATFTAAGAVRRRLDEAGFEVRRMPGFGRKRHRLEGRFPGQWQPHRYRAGEALVVGAGLAGATTARALAERGWRVRVVDSAGIAAGASGNRAGVVHTTPSGTATPQNRFYQSSYLEAARWFESLGAQRRGIGRFNGIVQHIVDKRQRGKLETATATGHWPEAQLQWLDANSVLLADGGYLQPAQWCRLLLDHPAIGFERARVTGFDDRGFPMLADGGAYTADAVVVCIAGAAARMPGLPALPLVEIRGQVSECRATAASRRWQRAHCHAGYLTPAVGGRHCVGATFDKRDPEPGARGGDDQANLEQLRRHLPGRWRELGGADIDVVDRRVAFRCQARDFLPVAGIAPGSVNRTEVSLLLNIGHGSRGISGTPLVAELLADRLTGLPCAVDTAIAGALDPGRFGAVAFCD